MGLATVGAAVTDAGPLIHLGEIGCLSLLQVFTILHIPDAVWVETVEQGRLAQDDLLRLGHIQRHTVSQAKLLRFIEDHRLEHLHSGEQECLLLCQHVDASVLLTDDLSVRDAAKRLNLIPVGSLGIVVRAHRLGMTSLADAECHMAELYDKSSLFVTEAIVQLAIKEIRTWLV